MLEDGAVAGSIEVIKTSLDKAHSYVERLYKQAGKSFEDDYPNFDENYIFVQMQIAGANTKRKDMPVISTAEVKQFQRKLIKGELDIRAPFAKETNISNPFPEGLAGKQAEEWLTNGIYIKDGSKTDDKVKVRKISIRVRELIPIQQQIYFDKIMKWSVKKGLKVTLEILKSRISIVSSDNHLIDGHHRYLQAMLIDPDMKINALQIDLPFSKLLPLTLAYSDAIGNKRNQ
jgi:hypothetical protein